MYKCLSLILGFAAIGWAPAADAARIEGLNPLESVSADGINLNVTDETMQIRLPDTRMLTMTPWPKFLPQRFGKQNVTGTRQIHPAGPVDRLSFTRPAEASPWLLIGTGARRSSQILDNWQLKLSGQRWFVVDGSTKKHLIDRDDQPKPAMVNVGTDRWCVYLLDSTMPAEKPSVATETEPQVGWAAVRLSPLQRKCIVRK